MRLFVASLLGSNRQSFYERALGELVHGHGDILRAIPPGSAHVTWVFISQMEEAALTAVRAAVESAAGRHRPFDIALGPPFVLFGGAEARLVAAPITSGEAPLELLATDLLAATRSALPGVELSGMKSAHVTLARFRKHTRRSAAHAVVETLARDAAKLSAGPGRIDCVQIMSSELTQTGPIYRVRTEIHLRN
jgi:2'-5' RNA ligase